MSTVRRRRLIDRGWYACYLAALVMSLSMWQPSDAHAYCNSTGSGDCSQIQHPCPWMCELVNVGSDVYDPNSGCGEFSPNICRTGTCYVYDRYPGEPGCGWMCYYESYAMCVY